MQDFIKALLKAGASVDATTADGTTALMAAAAAGFELCESLSCSPFVKYWVFGRLWFESLLPYLS